MTTAERERTLCPRCSAPVQPSQEYCVECGLRLPRTQPLAIERASERLAERRGWSGGWVLPALLGLVVAILGTAAAIAISDETSTEAAPSTATGGSLTVTDNQETLTAPEPPTATTTPAATTASPATTAPPARPAVPRTIVWPPGKSGWTIVLLSVPQSDGREAAAERAEEARTGGLRRVGILNSSRFASLKPGYYVVFHGVFDSDAEATSALQRARGVFRLAYVREITP